MTAWTLFILFKSSIKEDAVMPTHLSVLRASFISKNHRSLAPSQNGNRTSNKTNQHDLEMDTR